ncbi:MAG: hypothetical protein D4R65_13830 [Verrucomicrobiaceae bacterium]|nr:MAG: hypothetical protein D4R65_13830 [Verrucomicrobiaceae bacterium]
MLAAASLIEVPDAWGQSVWKGDAGPLWSAPANWSEGVPDSNTAFVQFKDSAKNRTVTVDGNFTFQQMLFLGGSPAPYILTGGTLIFDRNGGGSGLLDGSTRDNTVSSNVTVNTSDTTRSSVIAKIAPSGTLTFSGTLTTASLTVFHVPNKGRLVISGNLVGAEDPQGGSFNQQYQAGAGGEITIEGSGVSSNPSPKSTVSISLGGDTGPGTMNLNRPAALAAERILLLNNASTSNSSVNLGADNAIANDEGSFRTQVSVAGESLALNTNGHSLDLSQKTFQLFPFGNPGVTFNLDMGNGNSLLCFARSSSENWKGALCITNFTKGQDSIRFGENELGITPAQLARITINGAGGVEIDAEGFLVVPE